MQRVWQQMRLRKSGFVPAERAFIFGASIYEIEYDARQLQLRKAAHCGDAVGFALQCILMHLLFGPERLFLQPTRSKGPRATFNARTEGDLFCDSGRRRIGPPQRLNRRAGTCSGLLGQSRCSLSRRAHLPDDGSAAP